MVELVETARGIRAVGSGGDVEVGTACWQPVPDAPALPFRVDAGVVGSATGLYLPAAPRSLGGGRLDPPARLPAGKHTLTVDAGVETMVRLAGPASLVPGGGPGAGAGAGGGPGAGAGAGAGGGPGAGAGGGPGAGAGAGAGPGAGAGGGGNATEIASGGSATERAGGLSVLFDSPTRITLGFRDGNSCPPTVTVPPTAAGLATAISHLPAAHRTTDPRRSHPAYRDHPPLIEFGEEDVPDEVREGVPETGIEFVVPPDPGHLLVATPLAFYLGATVSLSDGPPLLRAPGVGLERRFPRLPRFESEVADFLRRVVYLDSLVYRPTDPHPDRRALGLDPELVELPPDERLTAYSALPADEVRARLPDWHLSTYVEPRTENARALPYLLDRLSLVYLPDASELDCNDLLERTLDGFYRGQVASVDVLDPELGAGRVHAWLADGTPIDAFKTSRRALENNRAECQSPDRLRVAVVLNDPEMSGERSVADIYREHTGGVVDVSVHEQLRRRNLADVLEHTHDIVHYVGHCEVDGLCCPDGYLAADDLDRSGARAVFLNACGSYHQGRALVDRGSVVGTVTLTRVLDDQAGTVGRALARLLTRGFDVATATKLARRRVMMGKDYAVVGDGTYTPVPRCGDPAVLRMERSCDGFAVTYDVACPRSAARFYRDPFDGTPRPYGTASRTHLDPAELADFLDGRSLPVLYDGDLRWADDVAARLPE